MGLEMDKITWLATAADLELELVALRGKVLAGCLTQSEAITESLEIGLEIMWQWLDFQLLDHPDFAGGLTTEIWLSIKSLESEMRLHLCVPF